MQRCCMIFGEKHSRNSHRRRGRTLDGGNSDFRGMIP